MKTLNFKIWLLVMFFSANFPRPVDYNLQQQEMVCINVDRAAQKVAFMNGQKEIFYIYAVEDWKDGDTATVIYQNDHTVVTIEKQGFIWRYNNGTFTNIAYPWWYEGKKFTMVHTKR